MRTTRKHHRQGFTLVELLTVIAIIGILAAVLVPSVQNGMKVAKRSAARSSLQEIAKAYISYSTQNNKNITEGSNAENGQASSPALYAEVLARYADFTTAAPWYIDSDPRLNDAVIPQTVLSELKRGTNLIQAIKPISWAVVISAPKILSANYPILWTRGLSTSGEWTQTAPWGEEGGHIAFGDGHVVWYTNLKLDSPLISYTTNQQTSSYQEAIGQNARMREDD